MVTQSSSLENTKSFSEMDSQSEKSIPLPFQSVSRPNKETDDTRSTSERLPSHISAGNADTMDYSNCATSPSKSTLGYVSSIPGTIYYNGINSVTQPHIENARIVSDSEIFLAEPMPAKAAPGPVRMNSESSSIPRMNWSPPQPLAGNRDDARSPRPKYVAQPYNSSAAQSNIVPAVPIEDLTMDGFPDTVQKPDYDIFRKPAADESPCDKVKGYKWLLLLTALIVLLAVFAVVFSIIYVTGLNEGVTQDGENGKSAAIGIQCHPDCHDPFQPKVVCECECYTKKDDKYYTCGDRGYFPDQTEIDSVFDSISESTDTDDFESTDTDTSESIDTDTDTDTDADTDTDDDTDDDNDTSTSLVFEGGSFETDGWVPYAGDDDDSDDNIDYDDVKQDGINAPCANMCYRKNIHQKWDPKICHPDCYCGTNECPTRASTEKWTRRYELWKEWKALLLDDDRFNDNVLFAGDDDDDDDDGSTILLDPLDADSTTLRSESIFTSSP